MARLNSLGFSTSGEECLVIGTRGTETRRNYLKRPTMWFADRRPYQDEIEGCLPSAVLNTWDWGSPGVRYSFLSFAHFHQPVSSPPRYERNEYSGGRS